jgi:hypothetical protein
VLFSLVCLTSQSMMSANTISTFSSGSPDVRPCHIPGYSFMVLSILLARLYSALLTSGSVTVSASPCNTKKGSRTCTKIPVKKSEMKPLLLLLMLFSRLLYNCNDQTFKNSLFWIRVLQKEISLANFHC